MIAIEWVPLAGAFVGSIVGLTGVGGGAVMAPLLLFVFGIDLITVIATDLLYATITKLVATGVHHKNRQIDWQVVRRLWVGSIPATLAVLTAAHFALFSADSDWLMRLLGTALFISAVSLKFGSRVQHHQEHIRIQHPVKFKSLQAPATILGGGIIGVLVAATSIGAGALGAVILRALYPLRMTPKKLVATDTVHAIPVSLIAGAGYLALGHTDLTLLSYLLAGSIPAAYLSSSWIPRVDEETIRNLLGIVLFVVAIKLFLHS